MRPEAGDVDRGDVDVGSPGRDPVGHDATEATAAEDADRVEPGGDEVALQVGRLTDCWQPVGRERLRPAEEGADPDVEGPGRANGRLVARETRPIPVAACERKYRIGLLPLFGDGSKSRPSCPASCGRAVAGRSSSRPRGIPGSCRCEVVVLRAWLDDERSAPPLSGQCRWLRRSHSIPPLGCDAGDAGQAPSCWSYFPDAHALTMRHRAPLRRGQRHLRSRVTRPSPGREARYGPSRSGAGTARPSRRPTRRPEARAVGGRDRRTPRGGRRPPRPR